MAKTGRPPYPLFRCPALFDRQAARNKNFKPENIASIVQREVDGKVEWSAIYKWQDDKTGQIGTGSFSITQAAVQASYGKVKAKKDEDLRKGIKYGQAGGAQRFESDEFDPAQYSR